MTTVRKAQRSFGLLSMLLFLASCGGGASDDTITHIKPGSPVAYIHLQVGAGSAYDPPGAEGLAYYTAHMLKRGSETLTRAMVDDSLDLWAASLTIDVDRDVVAIRGRCLAADFDRLAHLFAEVVTAPTFPANEADKFRSEQLDAIDGLRRNDDALAHEALQSFLYINHPYGHPAEGYSSTVATFGAAMADSFYRGTFLRDNVVLGVAGGVSEAQIATLTHAIDRLAPGAPEQLLLPDHILAGRHVYLIEKENRAQAQLRLGKPMAVRRTSGDFLPLYLTMSALGRHRESIGRLFQGIRADRGMAYGAYAYAEHFAPQGWSKLARPGLARRQQYVSTWTYPKSINAEFCIRLMMGELADLSKGGLSADELEMARSFETNHFAFEIETPDRYLGFRADEACYNEPTYVDSFEARVAAVTLDDAHRVAAALNPDNLVIVAVVSDGEAFKRQLLDDTCPLEYPSGKDPKSMADADAPILGMDLALKPENIHIVKAEGMFEGAYGVE